MFKPCYTLALAALLTACAAPQPLPQSDLLPLALGQTTVPADWKHAQTPGQFDAQVIPPEIHRRQK